jgi:hypothetical protein
MTVCRHIKLAVCTQADGVCFGRRPTSRECARCAAYEGPIRGAGDAVKLVANALGIKTCGGCQQRREALNRLLPAPQETLGDPEE